MEKLKNKTSQNIFIIVTVMLSLTFLFCFAFYFILDYSRLFSDFAETISYCVIKNPYSGECNGIRSIYPPFAYLPFYLFALICKKPLTLYVNGNITLFELCKEPAFIASFLIFFFICLSLVMFLAAKLSGFKGKKLVLLEVIIVCFSPILYCFYRGNNIISCLILVMLFFLLYNSEKRWKREIANLCLACAIGIKIYPALILIFFIKDRRFIDLLKTLAYSIAILLIPFLLVEGGFYNLKHIWNNFTVFNSGQSRQYDYTNISLDAFASTISTILGLQNTIFYSLLSKILRFGLIISSIVVLALSKKSKLKMQPILLSLLSYELFMGVSYAYTLIFLIIPIIEFLKDFENQSLTNKIYYGSCFTILALPIFASIKDFRLPQLILIALAIKSIVDLCIDIHKQKHLKSNEETNKDLLAIAEK